jgi:mutator protein MutT
VTTPTPDRIRPIAIAIVRDDDGSLLVTSAVDPVTGRTFARPPGGGIEPGERAAEAIVRELDEELGVAAQSPRLLGVIEHVFEFAGRSLHEHVFVLEVDVAPDASLPSVTDADHPVWWLPASRFHDPRVVLVPEGLLALVEAAQR